MTRLNLVREGNGPIVVLSHALGCDLRMWDGVAAQLARAHTVLRYDHRNHGASERVPGALRIETLAQDAAELIQREAGGEPGGDSTLTFSCVTSRHVTSVTSVTSRHATSRRAALRCAALRCAALPSCGVVRRAAQCSAQHCAAHCSALRCMATQCI